MGRAAGQLEDSSPLARREVDEWRFYAGDRPPHFAQPAERELARLFDFYGVRWMQEPHTFVLERDENGRVKEAFTPDFYLPDQDLYIECTVMRQSLTTRKNRKIRRVKEMYGIRVKPFYRRDFERLAAEFGLDLDVLMAGSSAARRPDLQVLEPSDDLPLQPLGQSREHVVGESVGQHVQDLGN